MLLLTVLTVLAVGCGQTAAASNVTVTMRYTTEYQYSMDGNSQAILVANTDCAANVNKTLEYCTELPRNWPWDEKYGYVAATVYNSTDFTAQNMQCTTGSIGSGHTPNRCCAVAKWPGGDVVVKLISNNYNPVIFTGSMKIDSSAAEINEKEPEAQSRGKREVRYLPMTAPAPRAPQTIIMSASATQSEEYRVVFGDAVTLIVDVCISSSSPHTYLMTAIQSTKGSFTHYVCSSYPCHPDSHDRLGFNNSPLPVATSRSDLGSQTLDSVYVVIYPMNGDKDPKTGQYTSNMKFGSYLNSGPNFNSNNRF